MMKKLLLMVGLATVLAFSLIAGRGTTKAAPPGPPIQDFNLDLVNCLVPVYPDAVSPNPELGYPQVCAAGEAAAKAPGGSVGYSTAIGLIAGNRLGFPYVYDGPGWVVQSDAQIPDGTLVGDVASTIDAYQDGYKDVMGDSSNCGGPPNNCSTPLTLPTTVPEDYVKETLAWNTTSGCDGTDETFLNDILPGASAMTPYVRYRSCIDTVFLQGLYRIDIRAVNGVASPLNLVTLTPNWSPAGTHVNLIQLGGETASPTTGVAGNDTPQASISHTKAPYAANPAAPGLYARWMTEISTEDQADGSLNFVYGTSCKAIGGTFTDADADCLASVDGAHPAPVGQPVDPDDTNPDIDGDGLLDGVEVAWGSAPTWTQLGITVVSNPPDSCSDTGPWTLSSTAGIQQGDILDVGDGAGNWESVKVEAPPAGATITVQRCVDRTGPKDIQPGWFVMNNNAGVQGAKLATITDPAGIDSVATQVNLSSVAGLQKGDLLKFEADSTREIVKVESSNPVANPVQIQRGVARTTAQNWANGTRVYRFITDRMLADMDEDGRTDLEEMVGPTQFLSDPTNADTDGDTVPDGGLKLDLMSGTYATVSGCQEAAGPDGKPDCPDENGDSVFLGDTGMSANLDISGDGSSHRRGGFKIVGTDIEPDGAGQDNCPSLANADQANFDLDSATTLGNGDLYGDACDPDDDNDGFNDTAELKFQWDAGAHQCSNDKDLPGPPTPLNSPNLDPDSDSDGVLDGRECEVGSNPNDAADSPGTPGAADDPDKDGVSNKYETARRSQGFSGTGDEDVDNDQDLSQCGGSESTCGQNDPDSDNDGLSDGCEAYVTGTSLLSTDTDWDGTPDNLEAGAAARAAIYCSSATNLDGDTKTNEQDNCLFVINDAQTNTQPLIGNGKGIAGDDKSVPWNPYRWSSPPAPAWDIDLRGDDCDGDLDNDSVPDATDADGAAPPLDITYDDNVNGTVCKPLDPGGDNPPEDGASWDTDCDSRLEGVDALCSASPLFPDMPAGWATADTDKDGLLNKWEFCKWASSPIYGRVDSDGDGRGDCVEAADVQGDGALNFTGDVIYYAKAILLGKAAFGQDGQFDINADGALNFTGDVIQEAKFGLLTGLCK